MYKILINDLFQNLKRNVFHQQYIQSYIFLCKWLYRVSATVVGRSLISLRRCRRMIYGICMWLSVLLPLIIKWEMNVYLHTFFMILFNTFCSEITLPMPSLVAITIIKGILDTSYMFILFKKNHVRFSNVL
jgi:hypothetical protein